jgi:hypothetical protein
MYQSGVRRSNRIAEQIPITLIGTDTDGKTFLEHSRTVLISLHGASVVSQYKLSPEQEMLLRWPDGNKEAEVRVVGQVGTHLESYVYGVCFLQSDINFWDREFAPAVKSESESTPTALECSRCKRQELVEQGGIEVDVYAFSDTVIRYCRECGSSTTWRVCQARENLAPTESEQSQELHPAAEEVPTSGPATRNVAENQRKYRRTKVNFVACIRRPGFADDVALCEDMSRGGVRFKSRKLYFANTDIEIAVPYSQGSSSIFVPAKILYVLELDERRFYRYGVAFTKRS